MLEKNPANRKSAEIYLSQARGKVFPEYFYNFLQSYMLIFSAAPILSPDEKITRLKTDIANIINILKTEEGERKTGEMEKSENLKIEVNIESGKDDSGHSEENTMVDIDSDQSSDKIDVDNKDSKLPLDTKIESQRSLDDQTSLIEDHQKEKGDSEKMKECSKSFANLEGLVIITQLVTSCIRGLHHSQSKLQSLEVLLELAENTSDETILDRILPYIVSYLVLLYSKDIRRESREVNH